MRLRLCAFVLLFGPVVSSAIAGTVSCPDLSTAVQVAACPGEDDLKFTFTGFCSDNARMYSKDSDVCTDYQRYRQLKNVTLWESRDGDFHAYISCDLPLSKVREAKATRISVGKKAGIARLACTYGEGIVFTNRTRAECTVDEKTDCVADPVSCAAQCK